MDHELVVRDKMTERYFLNELDAEVRNQFEEHFFNCPDCALDVRAASEFVEHSKTVLADHSDAKSVPAKTPASGWFGWVRPALVAPVFALLLAVVGYQNTVIIPGLKTAATSPQVLPWASVNVGTWGAAGPAITVKQGQGFLVFVRIPPDGSYAKYSADLYNPAGKLEWSLTIPLTSAQEAFGSPMSQQDQWPLEIPGSNREAGTYTLVVRGLAAGGDSKEIGKASFELQIQK